tara:strand:- start:3107 stop:3577 length:471 start_codon:yes stop_codon:yes gene_type:complete
MGRSVSVPRGAICVAYRDISELGMLPQTDENGDEIEGSELDFCQFEFQFQLEMMLDDMVSDVTTAWSSMRVAENEWLGDEDKVLAYNGLAQFGCSTYGGIMSIWLVPLDGSDGDNIESLAKHWCEQVSDKFDKLFGEYIRVGGFSDGTAVYRRKQA